MSSLAAYEQIKVIGRGSFGRAVLVRRLSDSQLLVIKQLNIHELDDGAQADAHQEVQVLKLLSHPFVVGLHGAFVENEQLHIVMDFADGGDLHDLIRHAQKQQAPNNLLPEAFVLDVFVQITLALEYIHSRNILHRDLKTQNVFLTRGGRVMIGDFGISKVLASDTDFARTVIGTPYYLSPELCEDKKYNHKSDIWALGCVLYELATLRHAFDGNNLPALILKIIRGVYPPIANSYSDHLKELIASLLRENPDHRPDIVDILRLPFLGPHVSKHRSLIAAAASSTPPPLPPPLPIVTSTTTFVAAPISTAVSVGLCALDTAAERGVAAILPSSPTRRARAHASAVAEASMSPASRDDAQSYVVGGELASGELGNRAFYFPQPPMLMVNQPPLPQSTSAAITAANKTASDHIAPEKSLNSWIHDVERMASAIQSDLRGGAVDSSSPFLSPSRHARPQPLIPTPRRPRQVPLPSSLAPGPQALLMDNQIPSTGLAAGAAPFLADMFTDATRAQVAQTSSASPHVARNGSNSSVGVASVGVSVDAARVPTPTRIVDAAGGSIACLLNKAPHKVASPAALAPAVASAAPPAHGTPAAQILDTPLTLKQRQAQFKREKDEARAAAMSAAKERETQFKLAVKNVPSSGLRGTPLQSRINSPSPTEAATSSSTSSSSTPAVVSESLIAVSTVTPKTTRTIPKATPKATPKSIVDAGNVSSVPAVRPSLAEIKAQYRKSAAARAAPCDKIEILIKSPAPTAPGERTNAAATAALDSGNGSNLDIAVPLLVHSTSNSSASTPPVLSLAPAPVNTNLSAAIPAVVTASAASSNAATASTSSTTTSSFYFVSLSDPWSADDEFPNSVDRRSPVLSLAERVDATRAQCEECFGVALFERVYRVLRDASDAHSKTLDDMQCIAILNRTSQVQSAPIPRKLLPFVRYVRQLIALENEHFGT